MDFRPKSGLLQVVRRMLSSAAFFRGPGKVRTNVPPYFSSGSAGRLVCLPDERLFRGGREKGSVVSYSFSVLIAVVVRRAADHPLEGTAEILGILIA